MEDKNQDPRLAIEGDGATFSSSSSLFLPDQHEHSSNGGDGNGCSSTLPFSIPGFSQQEQDTASYMPWLHNAHDDPYGLISYAQSIAESRTTPDDTDYDGESDLQGLVSNILDEADSKESFFTEGYLSMCDPVGSMQTLSEEFLQYIQSEVKTPHNPISAPDHVSCEPKEPSADNHVEDFYQPFKGLSTSQQWLFNSPNGDGDSDPFRPQKLPPGLPIPNIRNSYPSQMQQCQNDNMSVANQPVNSFPDLSHALRSQCEMNSFGFDPNFEDHSIQCSTESSSGEQYVPQDINQLVSSFQTFNAAERDGLCLGDFPNMDSSVEQWKITSPTVLTQMTPAIKKPKQHEGVEGPVQMKTDQGVRNQVFKSDFQDVPAFSPQINEYLQQPKAFSGSFSLPNQYQNQMTTQRENPSLLMNASMAQYSEHHIHQGQMPNKIQSQVHKDMKWMNTPGFQGDDFSTRPPIKITNTRRVNKKQALSQNPNQFGNKLFIEFEGKNDIMGAGNPKQLMSVMSPTRHTSIPINPSNINSRFTLPLTVEDAGSRSFIDGVRIHRQNPSHGFASKVEAPMGTKERPRIQLYVYLEECNEQWKSLMKERKKAEAILNKTFPKKKDTSVNTNLPRTQPNSTEIDHHVGNQMREAGRVASLLHKMENLNETPLHINIQTVLNKHHMAISSLHLAWARCKHEIGMLYRYKQQSVHFNGDQEMLLMVIALTDMATSTKKLRAALWRALQMTLPKPVQKHDHHANREDVGSNRSPSPCESYSFKLF